MVVSRVSRVNYAVKKNSAYREGTHDPDDKYWDDAELNWKARNQMDWYLRRVRGSAIQLYIFACSLVSGRHCLHERSSTLPLPQTL